MAALLTLFSGFGLSMILVPLAIIYFPVPVAIALAAVVHLISNLYKLTHLWRDVAWPIVLRFGLPALLAAIPGALLLTSLAQYGPIAEYNLGGIAARITPRSEERRVGKEC